MKLPKAVAAWGCVALIAASLGADDNSLVRTYGRGVHLYNAGRHIQAHEQFSEAIAGGSRDPRVYYYRGLNYLRLGRKPEAHADFSRGAQLEAMSPDQFSSIGRSLQRVQGRTRLLVERYRGDARLAAARMQEEIRQTRYSERAAVEETVLLNHKRQGEPLAGEPNPFDPDEGELPAPIAVEEPAVAGPPGRGEVDPAELTTTVEDPAEAPDDPFTAPPDGDAPVADAPAAATGGSKATASGTAGALGNAFRRTLGGLIPRVGGLPIPGMEGPPGEMPELPSDDPFGAPPSDDPFDRGETEPESPAEPSTEKGDADPFDS